MTTPAERMTATPNERPSAPRLHLQPQLSPADTVHAPDILTAVTAAQPPSTEPVEESEPVEETAWEAEGGHL